MNYNIIENMLKTKHTTVYKLAKATGISPSTFSDWKSGRYTPKADKLLLIADFFGMSLDSLMGYDSDEGNSAPNRIKPKHMLPIVGEIRAGSPIITNETLIGYEAADVSDPHDYFYLRVCGDSMKNIGMVNGSLVLFKKQQYAENGDIVACLVGGENATVKRFYNQNRKIMLVPENDEYSPIPLSPESFESGETRILGVAKEVKIKL
ncbi:MAG: helix-turn-helix domain-containing protein [Clostridia bacterium]|nr:helix-turn-helix domain-containing protein [Clostridia bacterium]